MEELGLSNISSEYGLKRKDINKTVIIFASVPFMMLGRTTFCTIGKTFNELGYIVHYIYGFECSEENVPDMYIPTSTHNYIDTINLEWYKNAITKDTIIIFEIPYSKFEPYLELAKRFDSILFMNILIIGIQILALCFIMKMCLESFSICQI